MRIVMNTVAFRTVGLCGFALMAMQLGCAVPQPPGQGRAMKRIEPTTGASYRLYLPKDYIKRNGRHPGNARWPVVLTLHGLKPYDGPGPQVRSWEQEADRYGYIVVAPNLRTCNSLTMQFPLHDATLSYVRQDTRAVLAILDEVCRRTNADPSCVLATSFSSGGYLAHYFVNRFPERFRCLAVRGSNFNAQLLNPSQVPKYRDMKIGIFFGERDFRVCREESMRAIRWYRRRRFDVEAKRVRGLWHQRRPQTAAAFFAGVIGVKPLTPSKLAPLLLEDVVFDDEQPRPALADRAKAEPAGPVVVRRRRQWRQAGPVPDCLPRRRHGG